MNIKDLIIVCLVCLVVWLSSAVIRLENYHYANQVGMCDKEICNKVIKGVSANLTERNRCFETVQTRTHPLWHLYYALTDE
jgi:hypothetical protein